MTDRFVSRKAPWVRMLMAVPIALGLSACGTYVPDGATVIKVTNSRVEFDRAEMRSTNELNRGDLIKLKWYDENTYITTATLNPGLYSFRARSYTGGGLSREIQIQPDKNLYEIDAGTAPADSGSTGEEESVASGPVIKGRIQIGPGQRRRPNVSFLFIGPTIELRNVMLEADGSFQTNLPTAGNWRIEAHVTGQTPISYVREAANISGPTDLGIITLR